MIRSPTTYQSSTYVSGPQTTSQVTSTSDVYMRGSPQVYERTTRRNSYASVGAPSVVSRHSHYSTRDGNRTTVFQSRPTTGMNTTSTVTKTTVDHAPVISSFSPLQGYNHPYVSRYMSYTVAPGGHRTSVSSSGGMFLTAPPDSKSPMRAFYASHPYIYAPPSADEEAVQPVPPRKKERGCGCCSTAEESS
eukprot:Protomagalhaensia_wolfi_Nauph_80__1047@NODE_1609_length_1445_cov_291_298009_g1245_i0_p1_GENE_NODE_1609_length_1445_cov_291_298009_g1245_i0NODE_1609_length_1445_cov_291_298009_g1245_i0_p1_ORF_typecomplete_len191_score7_86AFOR_N/PF02730_15/0_37_NODE_1609_length_1445_cov_291_298009_g1245_i06061178